MDGWKLLTFVYACLYSIFVYLIYSDNAVAAYPLLYVIFSAVVQVLVAAGVFAYALGTGGPIAPAWRWLFPLMVADVVVGICVDAIVPADYNLTKNGVAWITNLLVNLWFIAPAYYLNFKLAYRGNPQ